MSTIKERTEIAQQNKRSIPEILEEIKTLATINDEVALSCFYVFFDKGSTKKYYTGVSVRFAELIASCWGNIHSGSKITSNGGMYVTVQGFVHDFEKNTVITVEVQRSLARLSPEKAMNATNVTSSIAFRNAVLKAIPSIVTSQEIKEYAIKSIDSGTVLKGIIEYFNSKGASTQSIEKLIGKPVAGIDSESLFLLIGIKNAIEEGGTTIQEVFGVSKEIFTSIKRDSRFQFDDAVGDNLAESPSIDLDVSSEEDTSIPAIETIKPDKIEKKPPENSLKSGLTHLANPIVLPTEEVLEDKIIIKKKRGRGRPRKN